MGRLARLVTRHEDSASKAPPPLGSKFLNLSGTGSSSHLSTPDWGASGSSIPRTSLGIYKSSVTLEMIKVFKTFWGQKFPRS